MADISLAILNRLAAVSAVTTLIANRIYPQHKRLANKVTPYVIFQTTVSPDPCFDGPSGIKTAVIRMAVISENYGTAGAVADAVADALDQQSGTWAGVTVQGVFMQDQGITDGPPITNPDTEELLYYAKEIAFDATYNA